MLVLAQALVSRPKFMFIDELSLGLAPVVVQRLLPTIREVAEGGVGVLLIEQFATVALSLAERAYIMEGGRIQFSGMASELRENPDLLHSAYLLRGSVGQNGAPPWRPSRCARSRAEPRTLGVVKPRLRGVSHQYAFYVALAAGAALVVLARGGEARVAALVYGLSLSAMFGASALYHRIDWSPRPRAWLRRLDHSMIFVLVAGTYTPFALLVLAPALGWAVLGVVWGGALAGVVISLLWIDAPRWLTAVLYVALGWVSIVMMPQLWDRAGVLAVALLATGGLLYTVGAVVYARRRPDPAPAGLRLSRGLPRARDRGRRRALRGDRLLRRLSFATE